MEHLITALWAGMDMIYFHFFQSALLTAKKPPKQRAAVLLVAWIISLGYLFLVPEKLVKIALTVLLLSAVSAFLNNGTWHQHIIFAALSCMISGLMDTVAIYGVSALMGVSYAEFIWMKLLYVVTVCLSKLVTILIAWVIRRIRQTANDHAIRRRWLLLTILFPLVSLAMLAVVFVGFQGEKDLSAGAVIFSVVLAAANVATIYLIEEMERSTRLLSENALLHQQMDIQTDSITALERSYRDQRRATHEFRHQLQTICDLLENGKTAEATAYVRHLQGMQTTRIFAVNSRHPIVDAVLNHKYQTAKEHGIDFQIQVNDLSGISMGTDALVVLLSNLLDNAIEACCRMAGPRSIQCSILLDGTLFLSVRNTSDPVTIAGDTIPTSKTPKEEHGFGLSRIRLIMKQLGAEYTFTYENGWFDFAAEIPGSPAPPAGQAAGGCFS